MAYFASSSYWIAVGQLGELTEDQMKFVNQLMTNIQEIEWQKHLFWANANIATSHFGKPLHPDAGSTSSSYDSTLQKPVKTEFSTRDEAVHQMRLDRLGMSTAAEPGYLEYPSEINLEHPVSSPPDSFAGVRVKEESHEESAGESRSPIFQDNTDGQYFHYVRVEEKPRTLEETAHQHRAVPQTQGEQAETTAFVPTKIKLEPVGVDSSAFEVGGRLHTIKSSNVKEPMVAVQETTPANQAEPAISTAAALDMIEGERVGDCDDYGTAPRADLSGAVNTHLQVKRELREDEAKYNAQQLALTPGGNLTPLLQQTEFGRMGLHGHPVFCSNLSTPKTFATRTRGRPLNSRKRCRRDSSVEEGHRYSLRRPNRSTVSVEKIRIGIVDELGLSAPLPSILDPYLVTRVQGTQVSGLISHLLILTDEPEKERHFSRNVPMLFITRRNGQATVSCPPGGRKIERITFDVIKAWTKKLDFTTDDVC